MGQGVGLPVTILCLHCVLGISGILGKGTLYKRKIVSMGTFFRGGVPSASYRERYLQMALENRLSCFDSLSHVVLYKNIVLLHLEKVNF